MKGYKRKEKGNSFDCFIQTSTQSQRVLYIHIIYSIIHSKYTAGLQNNNFAF